MELSVGFLSVRQHDEHGFFGGYLILNALARPLEFHCTLPVKPTRAQELLYGPTLHEFICGEQIAKALVAKAKLKPEVVLTDCPPVLALSHVYDACVALVDTAHQSASKSTRLSTPNATTARQEICAAGQSFFTSSHADTDNIDKLRNLESFEDNFDWGEPFRRIVEALLEAHPSIKAA